MKNKRLFIVAILVMFANVACEKTNSKLISIEGIYNGTLTFSPNLKSFAKVEFENQEAIADIKRISETLLEMHCYGVDFDTTLVLNYYQNIDSVMVCLTGTDFESMYGHQLGSGHMSGGMMGDKQNNETEWQHHMSDEHMDSDKHFGGFDMNHNTFSYKFKMHDGEIHFQGTKME